MSDDAWKDEPRTEKETMTQPQEEFIETQSTPSRPKSDDEHEHQRLPGRPGEKESSP